MPSIATMAAHVHAADLPVLIADTCILLDVIRSTHRGLTGYAGHAVDLVQLLTSTPPGCCLVVASIVPYEWNKHEVEVTDETRRHFRKLKEQSDEFHDACQALGIGLAFGKADYANVRAAEGLRDLSKRLLDLAMHLDSENSTMTRAYGRVVTSVPPSKKGGQMQDCTITEESLELCRQLGALGFNKKRVFCTSNISDYCDPGKKLHANLATDFATVGITFTTGLGRAMYEVTH